ncbi:MAG: class F sortase [Pseudarthrobacter sp.]|nr:class F sortase [Pseudarthrobacter sp.]
MPKERRKHAAARRQPWRRWNRGDLAILLCGVLAFLSFTLGAPLLHQGHGAAANTAGPPSSTAASPAPVRPPAPVAATGETTTGRTTAAPTVAAVLPPASVLPAAAAPVHINYPSADFDVTVHPLDLDSAAQSSRTIEPPATKDGYWLTTFGVPGSGSGNTTYVIGHSWEGADAPFNHLSSAAAAGDLFDVATAAGTISYRVEDVSTYDKSSLKDSPVWDMVPNRLVLISCFTEDPWGRNVVVTAYPSAP